MTAIRAARPSRTRAGAPATPEVALVAPLPPQVGGVASVAEWLLAHERELGCRYRTFDLRPGAGGRLRPGAAARQAVLLARFAAWLPTAPRLVHLCVACSPVALARDVAFLGLVRLSRRTAVAHVHGPELSDPRPSRLVRIGLRAVARLTAERVAVAPAVAAALGVSSRVIANPVRTLPDVPRRRTGGPPLRLLFVGGLGARKGGLDLLEAVARARADVALVVAGPAGAPQDARRMRDRLRALRLERAVSFEGVLAAPELAARYAAADALCLPSYRELLPMALLEAMSLGLPVVATRVGAIPDLVEDGRTGLLVEPGDVPGLARAIERLAADPAGRDAIGEAARRRALAFADPAAVAEQWRRLYGELRCGRR